MKITYKLCLLFLITFQVFTPEVFARSKEEKILNSSNYSNASNEIKEKISNLVYSQNFCTSDYEVKSGWSSKYIFEYDEEIQKHMNQIKNSSEKCLHRFVKEYMKFKYKEKDPEDNSYCKKNNCDLIKFKKRIFENNVAELLSKVYPEKMLQVYCVEKDSIDDYSAIKNLFSNFEDINQCDELKVGETKKVDNILNGMRQYYTVNRVNDKLYEVAFNLDIEDKTFVLKDNTTVNKSTMLDSVKACVDNMGDLMKDPSGRQLNFKIYSNHEASNLPDYKRPPSVKIGILEENGRANSVEYNANIKCDTIIHELLHLAGLFDEYKETAWGHYLNTETRELKNLSSRKDIPESEREMYAFTPHFNHCRPISKIPSIMSDQRTLINSLVPKEMNCVCSFPEIPESEKLCDQKIRSLGNKAREILQYASIYLPSPLEYQWEGITGKICKVDGNPILRERYKTEKELSDFKHFESIEDNANSIVFKKNSFEPDIITTGSDIIAKSWSMPYRCDCTGENRAVCDELKVAIKNVDEKGIMSKSKWCPNSMKNTDAEDRGKSALKYKSDINKELSLLRPAHFERIIQGSCTAKVKKYTTCMKYAYVKAGDTCEDRPKYCEDESQWLDSVD